MDILQIPGFASGRWTAGRDHLQEAIIQADSIISEGPVSPRASNPGLLVDGHLEAARHCATHSSANNWPGICAHAHQHDCAALIDPIPLKMAIAAQAYSSFFLFFSERLLLELPFESNPKHWLLGSFSFILYYS
jgi:hypothetical protein